MNRGRPGTTALLAGLLSHALVTVAVGGVYLVVALMADRLAGPTVAAATATAVAAACALPAYEGARWVTERWVGVSRPAGYRLLADDADRLAALGGGIDLGAVTPADGAPADGAPAAGEPLVLRAWLPDRVEPVVVETAGTEVAVR